ncbi:hypothetical protein B0H14DRAFT_2996343 [Mycena olivaceomarginata]|nr:hypothetical protein B0H14DRAFT_2996343 [Mycena olivaceomarginata]
MLQFREFFAWVSIDGVEAPEYEVEISEDQKSVTCWIASELGKEFAVYWRNTSYNCDTSGLVYMDGNLCGGKIIYARDLPFTVFKDGVRLDAISVKPFMFSSLEITDDDAILSGPSHQQLGLVELKIQPVKVIESKTTSYSPPSLSHIVVHERSKKAVTQQITLGEPAVTMPRAFINTETTGPELVKFSFKYRPLDILRANGIAPLPPQLKRKASAEPPRAQTPDDDDADAEEEKMLRERLNALEAKRLKKETKPRVKKEADTVDLTQDRKKKVKPQGQQTFVIDLT